MRMITSQLWKKGDMSKAGIRDAFGKYLISFRFSNRLKRGFPKYYDDLVWAFHFGYRSGGQA